MCLSFSTLKYITIFYPWNNLVQFQRNRKKKKKRIELTLIVTEFKCHLAPRSLRIGLTRICKESFCPLKKVFIFLIRNQRGNYRNLVCWVIYDVCVCACMTFVPSRGTLVRRSEIFEVITFQNVNWGCHIPACLILTQTYFPYFLPPLSFHFSPLIFGKKWIWFPSFYMTVDSRQQPFPQDYLLKLNNERRD